MKETLIACMDGLSGFKEAVEAIFPQTIIQKCIIHQIRNSLKYLTNQDYKPFVTDLKKIYQAPTLESAQTHLEALDKKWGKVYPIVVRSWQKNWNELSACFAFPAEIRRLNYTTNTMEGYNRQIRKVIKTKGCFPNSESVRKILYLATVNITKKWNTPIFSWKKIYNQLKIYFDEK